MSKTEDNLAGNSKLSCANCGRAKGDHFVGYKDGPHLWCPDNSKREFQSSLDRIAALEAELATVKGARDELRLAWMKALGERNTEHSVLNTAIHDLAHTTATCDTLRTQLAASEAGAGELRRALEDCKGTLDSVVFIHGAAGMGELPANGERIITKRLERANTVLATPTGKAAAERLARYKAALRAILNSDDNDLGTFARMCETVAREALEES